MNKTVLPESLPEIETRITESYKVTQDNHLDIAWEFGVMAFSMQDSPGWKSVTDYLYAWFTTREHFNGVDKAEIAIKVVSGFDNENDRLEWILNKKLGADNE